MTGAATGSLAMAIGIAALLGSIPFGILVARVTTGTDVRRVGSGNIGATNVLRASGPMAGALTLALDMGKGAAAVAVARAIAAGGAPGPGGQAAGPSAYDWSAFAAVAGHVFSPWLGFRGGKGVATAFGAILVLSPLLAAVGLGLFAAVVAVTRYVSLGSIAASVGVLMAGALSPLVSWQGRPGAPTAGMPVLCAVCALILLRHASNIARLWRGGEHKLGLRGGQGGVAE